MTCSKDCNCDCHALVGGSGKACPECRGESCLSDKILDWQYDSASDAVVPFKNNEPLSRMNRVIEENDVKEFIRRLKEVNKDELSIYDALFINKLIDKLAGSKLVDKE